MIVCNQCGFRNVDGDAFCGSCGGFLEWTGEAVAPPAAEEVPADDDGPKRSLRSRIQTALSLDVVADAGATSDDAEASGSTGSPGAAPRPPGAAARPPGAAPRPPGAAARPPGAAPRPPGAAPRPPGAAPRPPGAAPRPPGAAPRPPGAAPRPPGAAPRPPGAAPRPPGAAPRPPGAAARPPGAAPRPPGVAPRPPGAAPRPPGAAPRPPDAETSPPETEPVAEPDLGAMVASQPSASTPRSVAKTSVAPGETTIGGPATNDGPGATPPTAAVKPTPQTARPKPKRQPPTRKILPGDLICGECGEGNPPLRNFCSRCGVNLTDADVAKRRWWQRLIPRRRSKKMEAGARPWSDGKTSGKKRRRGGKLMAVYAKLRPIVAAALLLAGLLIGFSPDLRGKVTGQIGDAKDSVMSRLNPTYVPLSPIAVDGSSFDIDHPSRLVIDGNTLTSWIALGSDPEPALTVRFDEPFDLERVTLWNGTSDGFKDHARVQTIHFVFDTGQTFDLVVEDLPDPKDYAISGGDDIREADLFITSTYSSLTSDDLAISEIEFLFRR